MFGIGSWPRIERSSINVLSSSSCEQEFRGMKVKVVFEVGGEYVPLTVSGDQDGIDDFPSFEVKLPSFTRMFIDVCRGS